MIEILYVKTTDKKRFEKLFHPSSLAEEVRYVKEFPETDPGWQIVMENHNDFAEWKFYQFDEAIKRMMEINAHESKQVAADRELAEWECQIISQAYEQNFDYVSALYRVFGYRRCGCLPFHKKGWRDKNGNECNHEIVYDKKDRGKYMHWLWLNLFLPCYPRLTCSSIWPPLSTNKRKATLPLKL